MIPVLAMVSSGVALPVGPALVQAAAARTFELADQAVIAIGLSVGAFLAGLVNAVVVEARLAQGHDGGGVLGRGATVCSAGAAVLATVCVAAHPAPAAVAVGFPLLMIALQLGRSDAVVRESWRTESASACSLGSGCVAVVILLPAWGASVFGLLALAMLAPVLLRSMVVAPADRRPTPARLRLAVGAETCVVAAVPLVLNSIVLVALGPAAAVAFRLVLTVLGILQPLLGYLRTVLLSRPAPGLVAVLSCSSVGALLLVFAWHQSGLAQIMFGGSWSVDTPTLLAACLWKVASIPATIPFAALRRSGAVIEVLTVRVVASSLAVMSALLAVGLTGHLTAVFGALAAADTVVFFLYQWRAAVVHAKSATDVPEERALRV